MSRRLDYPREGYTVSDTFDLTSSIIAYEQGELSEEATEDLFNHLVKSGLIYQLQGAYGREAHRRELI